MELLSITAVGDGRGVGGGRPGTVRGGGGNRGIVEGQWGGGRVVLGIVEL